MGRRGVANFIECEFARPTLFPVINLVARGTDEFAGRRMPRYRRVIVVPDVVHICSTSHFARYQRQCSVVLTVMNHSGLTKILASLISKGMMQRYMLQQTSVNIVLQHGLKIHVKIGRVIHVKIIFVQNLNLFLLKAHPIARDKLCVHAACNVSFRYDYVT
jgi:hypothetical protein